MRTNLRYNLVKDNCVIIVPSCSALLAGDSGISILAWSCGQVPPIPHVPLVLQPLGSAAHTEASWCCGAPDDALFGLAEKPLLVAVFSGNKNFSHLKAEVLGPRCVPCPLGRLYASSISHIFTGLTGCCGLTLARGQATTKAAHLTPSAAGQRGIYRIKGSWVKNGERLLT